MTVPFDYHGQLIGQKGKEIRQIMDECEVTITIPKPEDHSDIIKIQGPPAKIPHAEEVIKNRIRNLEEERRQRVSCMAEMLLLYLNTYGYLLLL